MSGHQERSRRRTAATSQSLSGRMGIVPTGRRELRRRIQVSFRALETKHLLLNLADHVEHAFCAAPDQYKISIDRIPKKNALVDFGGFKRASPCSGQLTSEKAAASVLEPPIDKFSFFRNRWAGLHGDK